MDLPFDGAISAYYKNDAPSEIRNAIKRADDDDILTPGYPHPDRMKNKHYEKDMARLQIELVKLQSAAQQDGQRVVVVSSEPVALGGSIDRVKWKHSPQSCTLSIFEKKDLDDISVSQTLIIIACCLPRPILLQ